MPHSYHYQITYSSVQLLSHVRLSVTRWTAARQAFLSITDSQSLLKFMSIKSVMPLNHPILCRPLLLLPSVSPSIRVFSNESVLHIRWPNYLTYLQIKTALFLGTRIWHWRIKPWLTYFWSSEANGICQLPWRKSRNRGKIKCRPGMRERSLCDVDVTRTK